MKQRRLLLAVMALMTLSAFGGEQEDIVGRIKALYDAIAQRHEDDVNKFACHTWWETVAAVEKKDAGEAEIGFFNDDLWTQMQDSNPDHFEIQNVNFLQLDAEKGTALVDFILYSTVQTIHQKFAFCREDGDWRVHNIIRCYPSFDGTEEEVDMMKGMTEYLAQPQEQAPELVFLPDLTNDKPLDLSDGKDQHIKYFPLWNRDDQVQEYEGEWNYDISLGYDMPLQQLLQSLPGKPRDPNEVSRVILYDLNQDGFSDALICLGTYGDDPTMYFDAYLWDEDRFGGSFEYVEDFRLIPNPRIDEEHGMILGRNGKDAEIWRFDGLSKIEKASVKQGYY